MKTNPWLGLSSYDEEKIGAGYKFCGRSLATNELFSLVDNNIFVTMYGKSGIGKTSLLQAGLFPKLRDNDYFPVYIRLGNDNASGLSYAKMIVDTINAELDKAGFRAVTLDNTVAAEQPGAVADDFLWHYFVTHEFRDETGRVVFPVVVIDQFEELFFLDRQSLVTLLRQIYLLIDDSSLSNSSISDSYVTNFRFLFSIREDDFFRLEDIIERQRLVEMKYNRYRLVELNDKDAAEVILQPAGNILKADEEQQIVQRIIKEAKGETGEINSAILSLLCSRLYDATIAKGEDLITQHSLNLFLQSSGGNFLASFFDDVMKQLNDRTKWEYIEDSLVTDDGRRNSVLESQFNKAVPNCDFLFNGKMAMLRYVTYSAGTGRHVEMIHDLLANHLKSSRNERRQKAELQRMRSRQRRNVAMIAVALLLIFFFAYQFVSISRKNSEISLQKQLIESQNKALIKEKEIDKVEKEAFVHVIVTSYIRNFLSPLIKYIKTNEPESHIYVYMPTHSKDFNHNHFDRFKSISAYVTDVFMSEIKLVTLNTKMPRGSSVYKVCSTPDNVLNGKYLDINSSTTTFMIIAEFKKDKQVFNDVEIDAMIEEYTDIFIIQANEILGPDSIYVTFVTSISDILKQ